MYFVKLFVCAALLQLASGINWELFVNSSEQIDYDFACCFERFERSLTKRKIKQRSAIIFLPELNINIDSQLKDALYSISRKNHWSIGIWHTKKCLETAECRRSMESENNYIFVENDDRTTKVQFEFFRSFFWPKNRNNSATPPNVCNVKRISNGFRENPIRTLKDSDEKHCSLLNTDLHNNFGFVNVRELKTLHVAGIASSPFVYYDAASGNLNGFDVSLITTVAKGLRMPFTINVIEADDSFKLEIFADR